MTKELRNKYKLVNLFNKAKQFHHSFLSSALSITMNFFKIFSALFLVSFVASEVSVKEILKVCKERKVSLLSSRSLFLGKLLYATDFLRNIRFFHADVQRKVSKVENDIIYVSRPEDSVQGELAHSDDLEYDSSYVKQSINPNLSLIVRLFPSPTGYIEPQTSLRVNFGFIMKHNLDKPIGGFVNGGATKMTSSIDFLAFVLYFNSLTEEDKQCLDIAIMSFEKIVLTQGNRFTVTVKKVGDTAINKKRTGNSAAKAEENLLFQLSMHRNLKSCILKLSKKSLFDTLYLLFDKREAMCTSENKLEGIDNVLTKSTIIQAFIAQLLQTEDQYKSFLTSFQKFEDHFQTEMEDNFVYNNQLINTLIKVEETSLPFPYSKNRQPSQNTDIQYYNRKDGKFFGVKFPNCVESSFYHFLNCLFWNPLERKYEFPAKQRNLDTTASPAEDFTTEKESSVRNEFAIPSKIVNFFSRTGKMRSNLSDDEWKPWHQIVEDLPNGCLIGEYENQKSYDESDKIFTHVTYLENPERHLNGVNTGFLNFFVVLATILERKDLLKGISKSCLDGNGELLGKPDVIVFERFVKGFIRCITNLAENDFEIFVSNLRIERIKNKPELMGTIIVTRKFEKKVVEFHLDTKDNHTGVRIKETPVLKFEELTETGELIDFNDAKNLIDDYLILSDQRFFISLYLKSLFEEDEVVVWQNLMKGTVDGLLYEDFLRFEIGNNEETFELLNNFYKIFLISLVKTGKDVSVWKDLIMNITRIIGNIILLPLPVNDNKIFKRVRKFYELADFLLKTGKACIHFPSVLPQLDKEQLVQFSEIGENFQNSLPKTPKFVEFNFDTISKEDMKNAQKEITHKYWYILTLFDDGHVSLKRLFYCQNFSIWDFSIYCAFNFWLIITFDYLVSALWFSLQFRINSKLVERNNFNLSKISHMKKLDLGKELMKEIPIIIEQLDKISQIPITSNTANDTLPESVNIKDLKQQLLDLRLIHAIVYFGTGDRNLTSQFVKNNLTEQLACLIYFELSRGDINKYFSKIKTQQYSSYIGNYIVEKMVPRKRRDFDRFAIFVNISKFGAPLIMDCNLELLIRYFEGFNKPNFESNSRKSILDKLDSPYSYNSLTFFFFLAQVIYRIHQKDKNYNFEIPKLKLRLVQLKKGLMDVEFFCSTETDQQEIVDYFLTFFDDASEHAAP